MPLLRDVPHQQTLDRIPVPAPGKQDTDNAVNLEPTNQVHQSSDPASVDCVLSVQARRSDAATWPGTSLGVISLLPTYLPLTI
jgi:hypothetical protein